VAGEQGLQDRPLGELVQQASQQTAKLVRQEIRLAQLELQEKGKRAGIGIGAFGSAGVVATYASGALVAATVMLLATAIEPWVAATIVGVALLAVAAVLALFGKKQVDRATPPTPERATESVQQDVDHLKARAQSS
jgi:uncharacterized membrane protein YqjE